MQVGRTKDQGLNNKPSAAVHPGALAAGTLPQYNTITFFNLHSFGLDPTSIKAWPASFIRSMMINCEPNYLNHGLS